MVRKSKPRVKHKINVTRKEHEIENWAVKQFNSTEMMDGWGVTY